MKRRVLVVDDDEVLRVLFRRVLEVAGYDVDTAADGEGALARIEPFQPDLVLLDLTLPGMDGWTVLERLRPRRGRLRVVVLSAHVDEPRARREGVAYLRKPFRFVELLSLCHRTLSAA